MVGASLPGMRICDVGCGSGLGVEIAALSLLSKQGKPVLAACDFSDTMAALFKARLAQSDFCEFKGNRLHIDDKVDYIRTDANVDLDALVSQQDFSKFLFFC